VAGKRGHAWPGTDKKLSRNTQFSQFLLDFVFWGDFSVFGEICLIFVVGEMGSLGNHSAADSACWQ
jgi:hypothetical protein